MPMYEYRCSQCGHELETLQRFSDPPLVKCPACGKDALTKLVSAAGFQLKGSGWYVTDFRGNGSGKKKDSGKPAADAKSDGASSETPSAKSDAPAATADAPAAKGDSSSTPATSDSGGSTKAA